MSSSKKRTLADELAELINPSPKELDPDAFGADEPGGPVGAGWEEVEEAKAKPSRQAREKGLSMRAGIDLDSAAYSGRKSSRAAIFGEEEEEAGGSEEGDDEEEGMLLGASDDDDEGDDEDELIGSDLDMGDDDDEDDDEDQEGQEDEGSEDEEGAAAAAKGRAGGSKGKAAARAAAASSSDDDGEGDEEDDELRRMEKEYEALEAEGEGEMLGLTQRKDKERAKGLAVRNQQLLYERSLETRILLQKVLQGANRLPRPSVHASLVALAAAEPAALLQHQQQAAPVAAAKADKRQQRQQEAQAAAAVAAAQQAQAALSALRETAASTLDQLMELMDALAQQTAGVAPPQDGPSSAAGKRQRDEPGTTSGADADGEGEGADGAGSSKRQRAAASSEEVWRRLDARHCALASYRDASVDRWQRRVLLTSGAGALRSGGLRALNQSVSSQVAAIMRDPSRLVRRTRLPLSTRPKVLMAALGGAPAAPGGDDQQQPAAPAAAEWDEGVLGDDEEEDGGEPRDGETFDDAEFYQQLLKELLERGAAAAGGAAAGSGALLNRGPKHRKSVDRRASKGRKIRYNVQEKLVNFMAPVTTWEPPPFAEQLFANLFGHGGR